MLIIIIIIKKIIIDPEASCQCYRSFMLFFHPFFLLFPFWWLSSMMNGHHFFCFLLSNFHHSFIFTQTNKMNEILYIEGIRMCPLDYVLWFNFNMFFGFCFWSSSDLLNYMFVDATELYYKTGCFNIITHTHTHKFHKLYSF